MLDEANGTLLQTMNEADWNRLIGKIKTGQCTPVIGPGAYSEVIPMSRNIAMGWTRTYPGYPFEGFEIGSVAQFVGVVAPDPQVPKDEFVAQFRSLAPPNFNDEDEPHRVLAGLPLPIYITTNYDRFMVDALNKRREKDKKPIREFCHWNEYLRETYQPIVFEDNPPTVANPVVYHLHGHDQLSDSLILTDDDYLDFLVNVSEDYSLIPERIQRALTGNSLLFLGYQLEDWNFRALFRSIVIFLQKGLKKTHVAVQIAPKFGSEPSGEQIERAQKYFNRYFETRNVKVYWGPCQEFVAELRRRWEEAEDDNY
jgi:hypothetical protein